MLEAIRSCWKAESEKSKEREKGDIDGKWGLVSIMVSTDFSGNADMSSFLTGFILFSL